MPPAFSEGLADWSNGNGTPESLSYDRLGAENARLVRDDPDFGACLELMKTGPLLRLRYMGEMPIRPASCIEITARAKMITGEPSLVRVSGWPGDQHGRHVPGLPTEAPVAGLERPGAVRLFGAVIGTEDHPGVDLVWPRPAAYGHVGIDIISAGPGIFRVESIQVRDVTALVTGHLRTMPGFNASDYASNSN